jgi:hypothetical protein
MLQNTIIMNGTDENKNLRDQVALLMQTSDGPSLYCV